MRYRPTWEETWMSLAEAVSRRSPCDRDQVGAVLVGRNQRVLATGYNGQPAGWTTACEVCPRNLKRGEGLEDAYSDCTSIHAEVNCLLYSDHSLREGSTLYVTRFPCWGCTKIVSAAGIAKLVAQNAPDLDDPRFFYLYRSGIQVTPWGE